MRLIDADETEKMLEALRQRMNSLDMSHAVECCIDVVRKQHVTVFSQDPVSLEVVNEPLSINGQ